MFRYRWVAKKWQPKLHFMRVQIMPPPLYSVDTAYIELMNKTQHLFNSLCLLGFVPHAKLHI